MSRNLQDRFPDPQTNEELLKLCDYATGEDMHVCVTMVDILRLHVTKFQWDATDQTRWMLVSELRAAVHKSIAEEEHLKAVRA